jgi:hypothetical protein
VGVKTVTIRQALQHVVDNPELKTDVMLDVHVHELVARTLFEIANGVQVNDRRTLARANVARTMIFNRLVGRRKAGSHPATSKRVEVDFVPLAGELDD